MSLLNHVLSLFPTKGVKAKVGMRVKCIQWNDCMSTTPILVNEGVVTRIESHPVYGGDSGKLYKFAFFKGANDKEDAVVVEACTIDPTDRNLLIHNQ